MLEYIRHYPHKMLPLKQETEFIIDNDINFDEWKYICCNYLLDKRQVNKYKEYIDWGNFSIYQELSEDIIREYKDRVNWNYISQFQKLSYEFIFEFLDKVNFEFIKFNYKLDDKTKELCKTFL